MSVVLSISKLSLWQKTAFSAALIERMLPNYQMFAENAGFGDFQLLRNQLDLVWQRLDKSQKVNINFDAQIAKLEEQVPDPQAFDFFGVYSALDASMAVMSLLQAMQDNEGKGFESISKLSANSVYFYVELLLEEEFSNAEDDQLVEITQQHIDQHPLVEWELATQREFFDYLINAQESTKTIKEIKKMACEQGLSNLGIEIN